jgi:hypothetical protein
MGEGHEGRRHGGVQNRLLEGAGTMRDVCTNDDVSGKKTKKIGLPFVLNCMQFG